MIKICASATRLTSILDPRSNTMRMGTPSTGNGWTMVNPGFWTTKHFLENIVSFPCQKYQAVCLEHEVFTLYNGENSNHRFLHNDIWNCFFLQNDIPECGSRKRMIYGYKQHISRNVMLWNDDIMPLMPGASFVQKNTETWQLSAKSAKWVFWCHLNLSAFYAYKMGPPSTTLWNWFSTVWFYKCALFRMITSF